MDHILVPVESLHSAKSALEYVMRKNARERLSIYLLNVQPSMMAGEVTHLYTVDMISGARQAMGKEVLRPVQALLEAEGIEHTAHVVLGEPAETIARYAAEQGCTSIVMGTRGMSAIGNLVLGSVATKVTNLADIPVTLIKRSGGASTPAFLRRAVPKGYAARRYRRIEAQDVIQGS